MSAAQHADVAVIGAGPAGLAAALSLAALGIETRVVAPPYDAARAAAHQYSASEYKQRQPTRRVA